MKEPLFLSKSVSLSDYSQSFDCVRIPQLNVRAECENTHKKNLHALMILTSLSERVFCLLISCSAGHRAWHSDRSSSVESFASTVSPRESSGVGTSAASNSYVDIPRRGVVVRVKATDRSHTVDVERPTEGVEEQGCPQQECSQPTEEERQSDAESESRS